MTPVGRDLLQELIALRERPRRRIVGLISGTSADGIDAALCEIGGSGASTALELLRFETFPLAPEIKHRIWNLPDGPAQNICALNFLLGEAFAEAALAVIALAGLEPREVDLIGSHGQTARHQPPGAAEPTPSTLQIGEAAVIAERTGLPVICDFRVADMAAGGHGAPLIPLVDHLLFHDPEHPRALLNLGGIANVSVLRGGLEGVLAFDTGPANMALDAVARAASSGERSYDHDGALAASGRIDQELLEELLGHPYFELSPPKSTGRETFGRDFVYPLLDRHAGRLPDLMATLSELTVESVSRALERFVLPEGAIAELLVSGGGVHNLHLMERLRSRLAPLPVLSLSSVGMDPDAKEAIGFAVLANETLHSHQGNIPRATGARGPRVLGKLALPPL
jgi:anhydro-N-acetylmuramic acid kinase